MHSPCVRRRRCAQIVRGENGRKYARGAESPAISDAGQVRCRART
jgi:hypothetical protein